jgi:hypothetical protein
VPDIQAQADAPPRRLANQGMQQHSSDPSAANVRLYTNGDLGGTPVDEERRLLIACELPRPRCTYRCAVSFGNESEILGPLPSSEMKGDERHRFRRKDIGLIRRDRQEIPKDGQIILGCRPAPDPRLSR